ncbi:MAG: GNAT family N-acetyltransferase [Nitrososphaerota archaeon]|nr:GNAT family N-acetyltransferase [Nitrososphaerota archaeon]
MAARRDVGIRPYVEGDSALLERTLGDPRIMTHLGGPESIEKLRERHKRYVAMSNDPSSGCMFAITVDSGKTSVGTVGYWEKEWDGQKVWETGWSVLPEFQGQGIATEATRLVVERVSRLRRHRFLYAYPSVNNHASNAICRKVGFTLLRESDFEYPLGNTLHCNVWQLKLV